MEISDEIRRLNEETARYNRATERNCIIAIVLTVLSIVLMIFVPPTEKEIPESTNTEILCADTLIQEKQLPTCKSQSGQLSSTSLKCD